MMGSLTVGAAQQTVLRLLEGQEICNGEMNSTHKICRKSQLGRSRRGWIVRERQYEDLDLCINIFNVQIIKLLVFAPLLQVPPHRRHRPRNSLVLILF